MFKINTQIKSKFFNNDISKQMCQLLGLEIVKYYEWLTLDDVAHCALPPDFDLITAAKTDKIDLIYFKESNDIRVHPQKFKEIIKNELRKRIRRNRK